MNRTNSDRKETGTQWFGAEGRNKHSTECNEETRLQKHEERLRNLNVTTSESYGCQKEKR